MIYINGERTFKVDFDKLDDRNYVFVKDLDNKCEFYLPKNVVLEFNPGRVKWKV